MIAVEDDFLVEHLDEMPDDGNRYELVDGLLLVSPSGTERHQRALVELAFLLRAAQPRHPAARPGGQARGVRAGGVL